MTPPGDYAPSLIKVEPKHDAVSASMSHAQIYNTYAAGAAVQAAKYGAALQPATPNDNKLLTADLNGSVSAAAAAAGYGSKPAAYQEWQQEMARAQSYVPVPMTMPNTTMPPPPPAHSNGVPTHPAQYAAAYNGWDNSQYLPQQFGYVQGKFPV